MVFHYNERRHNPYSLMSCILLYDFYVQAPYRMFSFSLIMKIKYFIIHVDLSYFKWNLKQRFICTFSYCISGDSFLLMHLFLIFDSWCCYSVVCSIIPQIHSEHLLCVVSLINLFLFILSLSLGTPLFPSALHSPDSPPFESFSYLFPYSAYFSLLHLLFLCLVFHSI